MMHRNIKPENILLDSNNFALISDFGLSRLIFEEDKKYTPEVPQDREKSGRE